MLLTLLAYGRLWGNAFVNFDDLDVITQNPGVICGLGGSGMRWGCPGSDALCHLRALYLSEPNQWDAFWRDHPH